jgi:FAD/FMN-containing dehydrogenase
MHDRDARQELSALIRQIVGESGIVTDTASLARYCRDWSGDNVGVPLLVVRPRTTAEVSAVVELCNRRRARLTPQGGHTGLVAGAIPSPDADEVILSLERMSTVREIDAENFSMIVDAGCILETVRHVAAEHGFMFPLALGSQGSCQIGGAIATNAGGLNVLRYGMMRDLVLGIELVLPDGRVWNGLKKLRKDNTGYDLKQLILGSEGTLGVVTAATLKLFPNPAHVETAFLALPSAADVVRLYGEARRELSDLLSAFELMTRAGVEISGCRDPLEEKAPYYILLEASASGPIDLRALLDQFLVRALERGLIIDGTVAASSAQAASFWKIREMIIEVQLRRGRHLRTDVSVPISAIERFLAEADAAMAALSATAIVLAYGHVGDGNLHYNVIPPEGLDEAAAIAFLEHCEEAIFAVTDRLGGSISAEHGIGRVKREAFLSRISPVHADLLRAIKDALDPNGIMSPGRLLDEARP